MIAPVRLAVAALALACASSAFAAPIQLLHDINRTPRLVNDWGFRAAQLGTNYVTGVCANGDCEPWITDGTPGTLRLLKALRTDGQSARANSFTSVGDKVFFIASAPDNVYHLWMTDGTDAGTVLVPLPDGVLPNPSFPVAGLAPYFFFTTNSGQLWRTDGTLAGATLLASGLTVNAPPAIPMAAAGGWVYFAQWKFAGDEARELWKTDGTPTGTTLVKDITAGPTPSVFSQFTVDGNKVYFFVRDVYDPAWQLYVSDGTDAGTFALATAVAVSTDRPIVANGVAYYFKEIDPAGIELWRTDGTPAGTAQLAQWPGASFPYYYWGAAGGRVYFGIDPDGATQTWSSDGTPAGTQLVRAATPYGFVAMGDAMYFGNGFPNAIWRTEGSPATTTFVGNGDPRLAVGGMLFLTPFGSDELWTSDGTPEGTSAFLSPPGSPSEGTHPSFATFCQPQQIVHGAEVFFVARDAARGCQLWKSDGTPGGTALVRDLSPLQAIGTSPPPLGPPVLTVVGNQVYFFAVDASDSYSLWRTDGSEAGTVEVKVLGTPYPGGLVAMGGNAYFSWNGGLWRSDGTAAGTVVVKSIGFPHSLTPQGNQLFFIGSGYPDQLWRSDGTTAGTIMLATGGITDLRAAATQLFFLNYDAVSGSEPWRSDGTAAGTRIVKDLVPGMGSGAFYYMGVLGDFAFFAGAGSLWRTDGTAAGTLSLAPVVPGNFDGVVLDESIYFGANGDELWRTNGMSASMVANDVDFDDPGHPIVAAGGSLYVFANTSANGIELFVTSGAPGPLTPVDEFIPGPTGIRLESAPVALPNGIFFQAGGRMEGVEPYVLPLGDTTPDDFSFATKTNVAANSTVVSYPVQITGIDAVTTATGIDGQVCVSSGATCDCDVQPFGDSRPVGPNRYICMRHVSSALPGGLATSTVDVGGVIAFFNSVTSLETGVVQFSPTSYNVAEGQPSVTLTVSRTGSTAAPASVAWSFIYGLAADHSGPDNGVVSWAAGDGAAKSIVIPIVDDALPEPTKYFLVSLSSPVNVTIGAGETASVNVTDNDSGLFFASTDGTLPEGVSGDLRIPVQRRGTSRASVSVRWTAVNGTAIAGQDFGIRGNATPPTGILTWAATDTTPKVIAIPILQDLVGEGPESFTIVLSEPSAGAIVGIPSATTIHITDDDIAPESLVSFSQAKHLVLEDTANAVLTVRRQSIGAGFTAPAAVSYATQPGTALAGSDYTTSTGTLTWATGDGADKAITIPIVNNAIAEAPESFKVTLTATTSGINLPAPDAIVTIIDDDDAFPKYGAVPADWAVPAGASAGWHVISDPGAFEGVYSLRSDAIIDNGTAQVEVTRTFAAGNVTFRVKISSEPTFDKLRFFVDGVEKGSWSGTAVPGWTLFTTPITAGSHTLRWSYEKDGSASLGADAAWVDAVTLP